MSATTGRPARPTLLHVCGRYLPLSETFTYDLIRGLTSFEHHVVASGVENLEHFPLDGVHVPAPDERAWTLARAVGAQAIVCHFGPQATIGMPIALAVDRPAVTLFHGYDLSRLLRDRHWIERYLAVARLGMQAICISDAGRRRLLDIGWPEAQVSVIRLGVDTRRFAFRPPAARWRARGPRRILMVARLVEKKGVHVALDAMARLQARGHDLELRVIGDGPERGRLEARIAELGLSCVTLLGAMEHARTCRELEGADLYIQPSITAASGDQEGIPVSLMEAQVSGLPVVATRHSGIPGLVLDGRTGWLTDEGDAEALADAIERLATNPGQAQAFAEAGHAHVRREFDRPTQTARFATCLEALASDAGRRPGVRLAGLPRPARRGLLLGSLPAGLLARKLVLLGARHPDVQWDVLAVHGAAPVLAHLPLVDRVWTCPADRLSLREVGLDLLRRLHAVAYDLVVVPYPDEEGTTVTRARRVATEVGARRTEALTMRDAARPLPARRCRLGATRDAAVILPGEARLRPESRSA